jgi:hypothetical protein
MYKESHMSIIDRMQFIMQVFDADPLVGSRGSAKSNWLVVRIDFLQDIFVDCKPLNNVVLELAQFYSHRYSTVCLDEQEALAEMPYKTSSCSHLLTRRRWYAGPALTRLCHQDLRQAS